MARFDYKNSTDGELLAQFEQVRDQSAFAELVRRHGPMVMATCIRVLGRAPDADDAFQATFFALAKSAQRIRNKDAMAGWLHQTAKRTSSSIWRGISKHQAESMGSEITDSAVDESVDSPMSTLANREILQILDEEIVRLPFKLRSIVVLCHLEGLSLSDAARQLGIAPGTAHARLSKSRAMLKARLLNRGVTITLSGVTTAVLATTRESAAMAIDRIVSLSRDATAYATGKLTADATVTKAALQAAESEVSKLLLSNVARFVSVAALLLFATWLVGSVGYATVEALNATPKQITIILPPGLDSTDGNMAIPNDSRTEIRTQELWSPSSFSNLPEGGAWLVALSSRLDAAERTEASYTEFTELSLSTSPRTSISRTYKDNVGDDVVKVFSETGMTRYPVSESGTNPFAERMVLDPPFFYDPSKGALLFDWKTKGIAGKTVFDSQDTGGPVGNFGPVNGTIATTLVNDHVVTEFVFDLEREAPQGTASESE